MPNYAMKPKRGGKTVIMTLTMQAFEASKQKDGTHLIDGKRYVYDWMDRSGASIRETGDLWPQESQSLGCNVGEEQKAMAGAAADGVPTEFKNGKAIFRDERHKMQYARLYDVTDKSGFNW